MNIAAVNGNQGSGGEKRRDFLYVSTGAVLAVGSAATLWPLINNMNPAADVVALSMLEVDLGTIELGQRITVKWRGQPVFIDHRTPEQIARARADDRVGLRDPEPDDARAIRPEWLVVIGICTHLGCVPLGQKAADPKGEWGGWFCPCHGSHYDTSGRIRKGPAPRNLIVPPLPFSTMRGYVSASSRKEGCCGDPRCGRSLAKGAIEP